MKRLLIIVLAISLLPTLESNGQSRKYISQFSFFQSYYNPALVGYEGSTARGFVRNQWGGFDGAPRTMFVSGEMDFAHFRGDENSELEGKNAIGLNIMHDRHGAFVETELLANYGSRIRLTEKHNLRMGMGLNYMIVRLDGNALTPEQSDDPSLSKYLGGFADMRQLDMNIGMAITHKKYYAAYSMQNINGGKISSGDTFYESRPPISNFQAGYRGPINENVGLIGNAMYRTSRDMPDNIEFNVKALFMDQVWLGVGHRFDYSTHLQTGFMLDRFRVGYVYEMSTKGSNRLQGSTHEFMAVVHLFKNDKEGIFGMW